MTSYLVTATPGGASTTVPGTATSAQIAGLVNIQVLNDWEGITNSGPGAFGFVPPASISTSYTFTVTARNSFGNGVASIASNALGPPGPPTNVVHTLLGCGNGSCRYHYTWSASAFNGGAPVTYYGIKGDSSQWVLAPANSAYDYFFNGYGSSTSDASPSPIYALNAFGEVSFPVYQ